MKCQFVVACLAAIAIANTVSASNRVLVESKSVPRGANDVTVGVYIENDIELGALLIPLSFREVSEGSFISDTLYIEKANRLLTYITGYTVIGYCPDEDNENPGRCSGGGFSMRGQPNFASPDGLLFATIQGPEDSCLPAGNDGTPPNGSPSLRITFGVNSTLGAFEIDTTCITPSNHLLFVDPAVNTTVPSFTKGIIEIGGPFYEGDSISGHIESDMAIVHDVFVTGDLTVDSGVTLTIARGTQLWAAEYQDNQDGGLDVGLTELVVYGELAIDQSEGERPVFTTTSNDSAAWYGIRVMPGGRFETGIGAVIEDAVIGVTIAKGALADTLSGLTITGCSSAGLHTRSDVVALIYDTVQGIWPGKGIYADSADLTIAHCLIDSCEYGLYTFLSSASFRDSRIEGPGVHGIYVESGGFYDDTDTLRFTKDTVHGYFSTAQMSVSSISQCRVDSCGFISDLGGQRSPYGIKAAIGGAVRLRNSTIRDYTTTGFDSYRSGSHLGRTKDENGGIGDPGNNSIYADTTECGGCALRGAAHVGVGLDSLRADENWWGASPPLASWFSGKVDRTPHLTDPLGKIAAPGTDAPLVAAIPREHSLAQNYPNPFNSSTEIEFSLTSPERVRVKVYNILGQVVKSLADREYVDGTHHVTWDGTNDNGQIVASGVYLYRIVAGDFIQSKQMVLLK